MIAADDILLADVGAGSALLEETSSVVLQGFVPGLFTLCQIVTSTCASDDSLEVVDEDLSESVPGVDGVWGKRVQPQKL